MPDLTGIGTIAASASSIIDNVMSRIWPDPNDRANAEAVRMRAELELAMGPIQAQLDVAKIEASSSSLWIGGARPAIVWVGALGLFCQYGIGSLVTIGVWTWMCISNGYMVAKPDLGITDLLGLVAPMLGVSWLRSQDKANGVATNRIN